MYKTANNVMTVKELGFMLTAYERFGAIDRDDLVELLADELEIDESMISEFNEFCGENRYDDYIYPIEEFEELELDHLTPREAFSLAYQNDEFNWADDYYTYHLDRPVSFNSVGLIKRLKDNSDFCKWYVENYVIDEYTDEEIEEAIEYCNSLLRKGY